MSTAALASTPETSSNAAYLEARERAAEQASWSNFDRHVVHNLDGSFCVIGDDECDFDLGPYASRIMTTLPGRMHGLY